MPPEPEPTPTAQAPVEPQRRRPRLRTALRWLKRGLMLSLTGLTLLLLIGAGLGAAVRDRLSWLSPLIFLPLTPVGLWALGYDLARRGRSLGRLRYALGGIGGIVVAAGLALSGPWQRLPAHAILTDHRPIRLIQWDLGAMDRDDGRVDPAVWEATMDRLVVEQPDALVLGRPPADVHLDELGRRLGSSWSFVHVQRQTPDGEPLGLSVGARWPIRLIRSEPIDWGVAAVVQVDTPHLGTLRLLAVEARVGPAPWDRRAALRDVLQIHQRAGREGLPLDAIVGGFAAPPHSVGFDGLRGDFRRLGRYVWGWEQTWPRRIPLWTLDHAWLSRRWQRFEAQMLQQPGNPHRGQLVRFTEPKPGPSSSSARPVAAQPPAAQ